MEYCGALISCIFIKLNWYLLLKKGSYITALQKKEDETAVSLKKPLTLQWNRDILPNHYVVAVIYQGC